MRSQLLALPQLLSPLILATVNPFSTHQVQEAGLCYHLFQVNREHFQGFICRQTQCMVSVLRDRCVWCVQNTLLIGSQTENYTQCCLYDGGGGAGVGTQLTL